MDSALISLMFFPSKKNSAAATERADHLRELFDVVEPSVLQNRVVRNHLAHLDERFDDWGTNSKQRTFGRGMLGSRRDAESIGLNSKDTLGILDQDTLTFSFQEDDISIDDLVFEIQRIAYQARRLLRLQLKSSTE